MKIASNCHRRVKQVCWQGHFYWRVQKPLISFVPIAARNDVISSGHGALGLWNTIDTQTLVMSRIWCSQVQSDLPRHVQACDTSQQMQCIKTFATSQVLSKAACVEGSKLIWPFRLTQDWISYLVVNVGHLMVWPTVRPMGTDRAQMVIYFIGWNMIIPFRAAKIELRGNP